MWFTYPLSVPGVVYGWNCFFNFSSLVIAIPCLSPLDQLVLSWCDLHFHCRYRRWCMDGKFSSNISQVWLHCTLHVISWSACLELMWFIYPLLVPVVVYKWKLFYYYFSSLFKAVPCLSPLNQLVLSWCDLHIHYRYRQWCMDGKHFHFFFSQV
jgi:hypothetical protein